MRKNFLLFAMTFLLSVLSPVVGMANMMEDELKMEFENAKDVPSIDDFQDLSTSGQQTCVLYTGSSWFDWQIGSYTKSITAGTLKGRGPRFPDLVGKTTVKKGFCWRGRTDCNVLIERDKVETTDRELIWKTSISNETYYFRRSGAYIYTKLVNSSITYYGYCWNEKN